MKVQIERGEATLTISQRNPTALLTITLEGPFGGLLICRLADVQISLTAQGRCHLIAADLLLQLTRPEAMRISTAFPDIQVIEPLRETVSA